MSQSKKLLRGAMVLTVGQLASYALAFARNVILARLLTKADFGLAALFSMTLLMLEVAGRMSFGQQIIQSKDGDAESFQGTSQAFQFTLAAVGAFLILILSHPLAHVFKVPQLTWAFASLAFVPLARGLEHLDYFRRQRELNYLPTVLCEIVPQAIVTLAAWPLTLWLGDFRVIVWLMIGKTILGILMTHVLAKRPYSWDWRPDYLKGMWIFGWPLLLNGLLMFASQQADQILVGAFLSLNDLAAYALALSLVSIPWFIFGQVTASIMLPILSKVQDDPALFRQRYRLCVEYAAVGAVILTLPLIVSGEQLLTLLYGSKYSGMGVLMALLGTTSAIRFLRFVPAVAAMARADTMNQLYSNVSRALSLPLATIVALSGGGMAMFAICALVAEVVAATVSVMRLRRRLGVPLSDTAGAIVYVCGLVLTELALITIGAAHWGFLAAAAAVLGLLALSILAAWIAFPNLAQTMMKTIENMWAPGIRQPAPDSPL